MVTGTYAVRLTTGCIPEHYAGIWIPINGPVCMDEEQDALKVFEEELGEALGLGGNDEH